MADDRKVSHILYHKKRYDEVRSEILKIVEDMLDNVSEETLLKSCRIICQQDYDDITVERSLAGVCGYPLCENVLSKVFRQKFHISVNSKTVYDITERKRFCSNSCFKASNYLTSQLPPEPRWLLTNDGIDAHWDRPIRLLPSDENYGCPGQIVIGKTADSFLEETDHSEFVPEEEKPVNPVASTVCNEELQKLAANVDSLNLSIQERVLDGSSDLSERKLTSDFKKRGKNDKNGNKIIKPIQKVKLLSQSNESNVGREKIVAEQVESSILASEIKEQNKYSSGSTTQQRSSQKHFRRVCDVLSQWVTTETMQLVAGIGPLCLEKEMGGEFETFLDESGDSTGASDDEINCESALPAIGEANEKRNCDVKSESRNAAKDPSPSSASHTKKKPFVQRKKRDSGERFLPAVEGLSQFSARVEIVHSKFCTVFTDILPPMGMAFSNCLSDALRSLVRTFNLVPTNVVFKPTEQVPMAIALLLVLCRRDEELAKNLRTASSRQFMDVLLSGFGVTVKTVDEIVSQSLKDHISVFQ